jgi:hypothetical protein
MEKSNKISDYYQNQLDLFRQLVETNPVIEIKGATIPYVSYNGYMFAYLEKDGSFGLRLPADAINGFLKKYKTTLFRSYGVIKKEFVLVPDELLRNIKELTPFFKLSFEHVKSLKQK